jgi:hypothetical protein
MWHQSLTNLDEQGYGRVVVSSHSHAHAAPLPHQEYAVWLVYIARLVCDDAVRGDSHATCHHSTTARAELDLCALRSTDYAQLYR